MTLVKMVYAVTSTFPQSEIYGLVNQMRRASVSIPSNVAEGAARTGTKEFLQFLSVSRGSLSELETQILIAKDLGYIQDVNELLRQTDKLFGLLGGLIKSLRERNKQ